MDETNETQRVGRRSVLQQAALLGGVPWVAPVMRRSVILALVAPGSAAPTAPTTAEEFAPDETVGTETPTEPKPEPSGSGTTPEESPTKPNPPEDVPTGEPVYEGPIEPKPAPEDFGSTPTGSPGAPGSPTGETYTTLGRTDQLSAPSAGPGAPAGYTGGGPEVGPASYQAAGGNPAPFFDPAVLGDLPRTD